LFEILKIFERTQKAKYRIYFAKSRRGTENLIRAEKHLGLRPRPPEPGSGVGVSLSSITSVVIRFFSSFPPRILSFNVPIKAKANTNTQTHFLQHRKSAAPTFVRATPHQFFLLLGSRFTQLDGEPSAQDKEFNGLSLARLLDSLGWHRRTVVVGLFCFYS